MENTKKTLTTVDAEDGASLSIVGDTYRTIIAGNQTEGAYAVIDMLVPPGGGPGPHAHPDINESFYVIEGEIEFKSETGTYIAGKGSFVNIPKGGIVHGFKNKTETLAHLLCTAIPAGMENFFEEIGVPVARGTFLPPPTMDENAAKKLQQIAEKHGQKVFPPDYLDK